MPHRTGLPRVEPLVQAERPRKLYPHTIVVRFDQALHEAVVDAADAAGQNLSEFIREYLRARL